VSLTSELTIGEVAVRSGVAPSALRFYEAAGLIASSRTSGNQRRYGRATLRRIAVIQAGRIVTQGTPGELIGATRRTEIRYGRNGETTVVETDEPTRVLHELTSQALASGHELENLEVRRPTLEDVYLELVGDTVDEAAE